MCANPYRGEVSLDINGQAELFKLNLGAIAFLESKLETHCLAELVDKFSNETYTAQDIVYVLEAGYFGANKRHIHINEVTIDGGVKAAAIAAICLLKLAFEGVKLDA